MKEIIEYIESIGFKRDIEDNVWYNDDYSERVVPAYYTSNAYNIYYDSGSFNNPNHFRTLEELKILRLKRCTDFLEKIYNQAIKEFNQYLDLKWDIYNAQTKGFLPTRL